ncbi:MAG TPA: Clp protease N-terminal domain-containing protein [Gemmataceae bacterium]|jgi:hypothetical protein
MYERFTDRARKVMQLANQEAQRLNHEYVGTENILLGLVKEGSGVAANVLKNLDIDLRKIRLEVEKIIYRIPDQAPWVPWPKLPQTPRAKLVIERAIEEAKNLNDNYVGTEHLLLGLVRDEDGVASQVLMNLGLKLADVRKGVLQILGQEKASEESHSGRVLVRRWSRSCRSEDSASKTKDERSTESDRLRSLEQQLWNVRIMLGALAGALAGTLLAASTGTVLGLIVGGSVAALGRRIPAALIAGIAGLMLGSAHLPVDGGGVAGALLGGLVGFLIAEIGRPIARN